VLAFLKRRIKFERSQIVTAYLFRRLSAGGCNSVACFIMRGEVVAVTLCVAGFWRLSHCRQEHQEPELATLKALGKRPMPKTGVFVMRTLFIASTIGLGLMAISASAVPLSCNTAVQNWQNGSQDTCPYAGGSSAYPVNFVVLVYTPPDDEVIEEEDVPR
jgi:hypothetical protein